MSKKTAKKTSDQDLQDASGGCGGEDIYGGYVSWADGNSNTIAQAADTSPTMNKPKKQGK